MINYVMVGNPHAFRLRQPAQLSAGTERRPGVSAELDGRYVEIRAE